MHNPSTSLRHSSPSHTAMTQIKACAQSQTAEPSSFPSPFCPWAFVSAPPTLYIKNLLTCFSVNTSPSHPPAGPWASEASSACHISPTSLYKRHTLTSAAANGAQVWSCLGMAPKREPSIKKSPSLVNQTRLGPPYPCLPATPVAPKQAPEQKPRMLRPSDVPFDPSTLEVSGLTTFYDKVCVGH